MLFKVADGIFTIALSTEFLQQTGIDLEPPGVSASCSFGRRATCHWTMVSMLTMKCMVSWVLRFLIAIYRIVMQQYIMISGRLYRKHADWILIQHMPCYSVADLSWTDVARETLRDNLHVALLLSLSFSGQLEHCIDGSSLLRIASSCNFVEPVLS